jgi:hypothetical protein
LLRLGRALVSGGTAQSRMLQHRPCRRSCRPAAAGTASACRREVQQYKLMDDEFELTVVLQLDEAVPLDQVTRHRPPYVALPLRPGRSLPAGWETLCFVVQPARWALQACCLPCCSSQGRPNLATPHPPSLPLPGAHPVWRHAAGAVGGGPGCCLPPPHAKALWPHHPQEVPRQGQPGAPSGRCRFGGCWGAVLPVASFRPGTAPMQRACVVRGWPAWAALQQMPWRRDVQQALASMPAGWWLADRGTLRREPFRGLRAGRQLTAPRPLPRLYCSAEGAQGVPAAAQGLGCRVALPQGLGGGRTGARMRAAAAGGPSHARRPGGTVSRPLQQAGWRLAAWVAPVLSVSLYVTNT